MSQIHESSACVSEVMASLTVGAIIVTEMVAGFYLSNCVVTVS